MVVYPRWRGELNIGNGFAAAASGLSPLARGTRQNGLSSLVRLRFIPAGAGNTGYHPLFRAYRAVYPRWRGEHTVRIIVTTENRGLSPLARGTLLCREFDVKPRRFIPAGAGNTCELFKWASNDAVYPRWRGEHYMTGTLPPDVCGLSPLARGTL